MTEKRTGPTPDPEAPDPNRKRRSDYREITRDELVAAVRDTAGRLGVRLLAIEKFRLETGINFRQIYDHFESWGALCRAAGLEAREPSVRVADQQIFADMLDAFLAAGGIDPWNRLRRRVPWGAAVPVRRWGNWGNALTAFRDWARLNVPEFPYMEELGARIEAQARRKAAGKLRPPAPPWPSTGGRACGAPLGFRGMLHAPVNEQGVVLLFGMVAEALGYRVETVATGFPDCTAKRQVAPDRWEGVRIEFEYRSRSFRDHGHDSKGCEVVVCWEHDWPGCPLEVLSLREAVAALAQAE